jgi:hypothetical protein
MPRTSPPIVPGETPFTGHHWYVGLLAACVGFIYLFWCPVYLWLPWMILGGLVAIDDAWKHHRQKANPGYLSPYNRLCLWFILKWQPGLSDKGEDLITTK